MIGVSQIDETDRLSSGKATVSLLKNLVVLLAPFFNITDNPELSEDLLELWDDLSFQVMVELEAVDKDSCCHLDYLISLCPSKKLSESWLERV